MTSVIRVLYAEDEENDILFMRRALRAVCPQVELAVARNGEEAIGMLSDGHYRPDWVILDLKMPRRSGLDVLTWIRGNERLKNLPVSILTSSAEQSDMGRVDELGIEAYMVKPVSYEGLLGMVRSLCARWSALLPPSS